MLWPYLFTPVKLRTPKRQQLVAAWQPELRNLATLNEAYSRVR